MSDSPTHTVPTLPKWAPVDHNRNGSELRTVTAFNVVGTPACGARFLNATSLGDNPASGDILVAEPLACGSRRLKERLTVRGLMAACHSSTGDTCICVDSFINTGRGGRIARALVSRVGDRGFERMVESNQ